MKDSLRVLIVEDSKEDTELIALKLRRGGFEPEWERVETAETMKEALERKSRNLVISDYSMPNFNGLEALEVLKKSGLDIPFILVSGKIGEELAVEAMRKGAHDYLMKYNLARLVPAVKRELKEAEVRRKQKKGEEKLKEREENLRTTLNSIGDAVISTGLDGNIVRMNPNAEELTGWSEDAALGKPINEVFNIVDANTRETEENPVDKILEEGKIVGLANDTVLISKDGKEYQIADSGSPIKEDDGNITGVVLVFRDVTETYQMQQKLKESEKRFRQFFEKEPAYCYMLSPSGTILDVNRSALETLGYEKDELEGNHIKKVYSPECRERMKELFSKWKREGELFNEEMEIITKDGDRRTVLLSAGNVRDEKGDINLSISVQTDITERVRAEEKLQESEERLGMALEGARAGLWDWNVQTGEIVYDERWAEIVGYELEELAPVSIETWEELTHPKDLKRSNELLEKPFAGETDFYEFEGRMKHKNGDWVWIQDRGRVVEWDDEGNPVRMVGTHIDITKRKEAEEKVKKANKDLEKILDNVPAMIWYKDTDNNFIRVNKAAAEATGMKPEEIEGPAEEAYPNQAKEYYEDDLEVIKSEEPKTGIIEKMGTAEGEERWVHTDKVPYYDKDGNIAGVIVLSIDITERKQAEEELRLFKTVVESSQEAIAISDPDAQLVYINPAHQELFGRSLEEAQGMDYRDYYPPESIEILNCDVAPALARGESWEGELDVFDAHGRRFPLWERADSIHDAKGNMLFGFGFMHDITERKRAEEALQEYSKRLEEMVEERTRELRDAQEELIRQERLAALGQIAGSIGHELRNPLGVIHNANYYLGMKLAEADEDVKESLELINEETQNASKIIANLLDFGRAQVADSALVNVSEVVNAVIGQNPPPDEVTLSVAVPDNLPPIFVDELQIKQVLTNLVTNAYQAMPEGGELSVNSKKWSVDSVLIEVSDTGTGIPPENMEKIFKPLFTTRARGIGLGLAICKKLVEANGGKIEVESEVNEGTTFRIFLPVAKETDKR